MPRTPEAPEKTDWRRQAREVADSLAIAFILAMVIRHFVLEVFKIPTKSMQPTLMGDPVYGDKILVNKFAYDFKDPERWDVAVFKFPEDTSKNYIKRVVGLPGEKVLVRDGNLLINGVVERKPWPVQNALWRRSFDSEKRTSWLPDNDGLWQREDGCLEVDCDASTEVEVCRYEPKPLAYGDAHFLENRKSFQQILTSDVMVQFRLTPQRVGGSVHVGIDVVNGSTDPQVVDEWAVALPVAEGDAEPEVFRGEGLDGNITTQPYRLKAGAPTLVQVCNVDHTFIVRVGGAEVVRCEYKASRASTERPNGGKYAHHSYARVRIGCRQGHVVFRQPSIFADVYYTSNDLRLPHGVSAPFTLGDDQFFVLGDNSVNSNDSRGWKSVPRSYLVGEAFLVLWPLGRMKLVR